MSHHVLQLFDHAFLFHRCFSPLLPPFSVFFSHGCDCFVSLHRHRFRDSPDYPMALVFRSLPRCTALRHHRKMEQTFSGEAPRKFRARPRGSVARVVPPFFLLFLSISLTCLPLPFLALFPFPFPFFIFPFSCTFAFAFLTFPFPSPFVRLPFPCT